MANRHTEVETITPAQRLQLIGLMKVGADLIRRLRDVEIAALEITGEGGEYGYTSDEMWDEQPDVDALLNRLEISVVADPGVVDSV